jgi:tetratricopeptide (TPR) repeat protein
LILLNPIRLLAQDEALPLLQKMQKSKGNEKVDLLNEISAVYRKTDRDKSMEYAKQAFKLAVENKYLPGQALAKKNEGICWFFYGNNDSAKICYNQSLIAFTKTGDKKGMSACYNNLGLIAQGTGKYDEAIKYYELSIEKDYQIGDELGVAATKGNIVAIYVFKGNTKAALNLSNDILNMSRNHSDYNGIMNTLLNRASIYDNLNRTDEATADLEEAIRIAKKQKDKYIESLAMSNLGFVTWHKGNPEEALKILNQVLELNDQSEEEYEVLNALWIMSDIYASKKEYVRSNEILQKILKKYEEIDDSRQEARVLTSLGRNLIELNEIDKGLGYLTQSLKISIEIDALTEKLENYRNLSHAYAILHDLKAADSIQDAFAELYSDLFKNDSTSASQEVITIANDRNLPNTSGFSRWVIAFLLFVIIVFLSLFGFKK